VLLQLIRSVRRMIEKGSVDDRFRPDHADQLQFRLTHCVYRPTGPTQLRAQANHCPGNYKRGRVPVQPFQLRIISYHVTAISSEPPPSSAFRGRPEGVAGSGVDNQALHIAYCSTASGMIKSVLGINNSPCASV
jgi:hypothetical protein